MTPHLPTVAGADRAVRTALRGTQPQPQDDGDLLMSKLPAWALQQSGPDPLLAFVAASGSGVRLQFSTAASRLRLSCSLTWIRFDGRDLPAPRFGLVVDGMVTTVPVETAPGVFSIRDEDFGRITPSPPAELLFELGDGDDGAPRVVEIWLPQACRVALHAIWADAAIHPVAATQPRWVHYGSSISQGQEADSPMAVWPVLVARRCGLDLTNMALSAEAMIDQFAARAIADLRPDLVSLELGANPAVDGTLRARTFVPAVHGFLDTLRERLPRVPILVISPVFSAPLEHRGGPLLLDKGRYVAASTASSTDLSFSLIRATLQRVVDQRRSHDPLLDYLDGTTLLGLADGATLVDGLHPDSRGHARIAARLTTQAFFRTGSRAA